MIHVPGGFEPPVPRLVEALKAKGHEISDSVSPTSGPGSTLVLARPVDWMQLGVWFGAWHVARAARILVISRIGAHPDARAESLRELWRLEEYARVSLIPTLVLRLAPLVGESSPFWSRLRSRPRLGATGHSVVMPVLERDVVEAMHAALTRPGTWEGWFDVAGPEARTLSEWSELAGATSGNGAGAGDEWEPPLEELAEHRLSEPDLWQARFGIAAREVAAWAEGKSR
jgi:uncharacterized protein YbjT (DUF2867 family)